MSRVGKLPVKIPENIKVVINDSNLNFDNGKIKKSYTVSSDVNIVYKDNEIKLSAASGAASDISKFVGMDRNNIKNIVLGLNEPFKVTLEINGVGYKASVEKGLLILTLGYSHEIFYALPKGIVAVFEKPNLIILS